MTTTHQYSLIVHSLASGDTKLLATMYIRSYAQKLKINAIMNVLNGSQCHTFLFARYKVMNMDHGMQPCVYC